MAPRHDCRWRRVSEKLKQELTEQKCALAEKDAQLLALTARVNEIEHKLGLAHRQIVGPKSERMPTPDQEAKKREGEPPKRGGHTNPKKRKQNAEAMAALPTETVPHPIPEGERVCPHCGQPVKLIAEGDRSVEYEWIPGRLVRRVHVVEVGRCPCKLHYVRGPAPVRVQEGCTYGPAFLAKLAVDKCGDAIPIYRVEKSMRRAGIPISRSTMNSLLLVAGKTCKPLWQAALDEVRVDQHVQADETSFRTQGRKERCFVWTFLSKTLTVYVFSPSRSADTANQILRGTSGTLTVDGYTGYNAVTDGDGRVRCGCWSHARRYLYEALPTAPEARVGLDIIIDLFMVEREAEQRKIVGTPRHLKLRQRKSTLVLNRFRAWFNRISPLFDPKSPMGEALKYISNQWERLQSFLDDPCIPIHNNASEAALRIIALARKCSLFLGHDDAGRSLVVLYSLIAMCEKHDVNPEAYLTDVLIRIQDYPKDRVAELMPHRWKERFGSGFTVQRVVMPSGAI